MGNAGTIAYVGRDHVGRPAAHEHRGVADTGCQPPGSAEGRCVTFAHQPDRFGRSERVKGSGRSK